MIPVEATPEQVAYWTERDGCEQQPVIMGGPEEGPDVIPCPTLIARGVNCCHVAMRLDEIEVAHLATGGTLWLTTWGGLQIHLVEVVPNERASGGPT